MKRFRRTQLMDYCLCFAFVLAAELSLVASAFVAESSLVVVSAFVAESSLVVASAFVAGLSLVLAAFVAGLSLVLAADAVELSLVVEPSYFSHSDVVPQRLDEYDHVSRHHEVHADTIPAYANNVVHPTLSNGCDSHDKKGVCNLQGIALHMWVGQSQ
jgi:hypothetical protein